MSPRSDALKKAQKVYIAKYARMEIRVTPKFRDLIQAAATAAGQSNQQYILQAVRERMERTKQKAG